MEKREIFNFKKSLTAVLFGFLLSFTIANILLPGSFFTLIKAVFIKPFYATNLKNLALSASILTIVSLAMSVSFRAMLFNIGIPGQMLAGAIIPSMFVSTIAENGWFPGAWILMLIIGLICGSFAGGLAGYLKSRFNVHEVISTIMLNWIIYYIGKSIFKKAPWRNYIGFPGSKLWDDSLKVNVILCIIIALVLIYGIWYLFNKTKLGYKITMIGSQPSVSEYAGYSRTKIQTTTLAISGGLAGLAGVIFYGTYAGQYTIPANDTLDSVGFNAIIISLIAFKNPLLIGPVAIIFAALSMGGVLAATSIQFAGELMALSFGLMIFIIALTDNYNYKEPSKPQRKELK